jgi:ubiquitin carboxyl-terminal hydrolase 25
VRSKEELWSDVKVDVATGPRDIYAAIDGAFDMQKVFVDGELVEQFGSISKLPPILQIQVQRAQFDPVKKTSFKSTHHLELKETIYLDRYMDTQQPELLNRRRQCWKWKDDLKAMEVRRAELRRQNVGCTRFLKEIWSQWKTDSLQEGDGQDMSSLFNTAKCVLEELAAMKEHHEAGRDAVEIDSRIVMELDQLSRITKTEIACREQLLPSRS